jgi:hypothetical protein
MPWLTQSKGMSCFIQQSVREEQVADQMRSFFSGFRATLTAAHLKCEGKRTAEIAQDAFLVDIFWAGGARKMYRSDLTRGGSVLSPA